MSITSRAGETSEVDADSDSDLDTDTGTDVESDGPGSSSARSGRGRGLAGRSTAVRAGLSSGWQSARRLTVDWLDRPMTSLHLVLAIFALMLGFGLLMVLSSSSVVAFRNGGSSFSVFANQATYAAIGLVCFCAAQFLPVRLMRSVSTIAVIVSLVLLVAVLIDPIGAKINGARSWIRIAGFQFQPSEIAKLALLLWMGHVLAARRSTLRSAKALLIPVLPVFVLMAGLIMMQPDLGTTVALTIVFMAVLFFAGAPWWIFTVIGGFGVAAFFYLALTAEYRLARLLSFIDPEAHPDVSYQLLQSLYGMGNGGWFGVGLGQSRAKWSYLPNADSDFIFAIIGEELGLIGTLIVLLLFALLAYTGLRIARRNVDPFVKIVASAGTVWLVGQAAINIGYVVGLLPVTGIPLPMISSGGTSLLITMVVFGLLANFARREPQAAAALQAGGGGRLARFLGMQHGEMAGRPSSGRSSRDRSSRDRSTGGRSSGRRFGRRRRQRDQPSPQRPTGREPRPVSASGGPAPRAPRGTAPRGTGPRGTAPRADAPRGTGPAPRGATPAGAGDRPRTPTPRPGSAPRQGSATAPSTSTPRQGSTPGPRPGSAPAPRPSSAASPRPGRRGRPTSGDAARGDRSRTRGGTQQGRNKPANDRRAAQPQPGQSAAGKGWLRRWIGA